MRDQRPRAGDRYIVDRPFEASVPTHWRAPYTGGSDKLLPAGLEFVVKNDPPAQATALVAEPLPQEHWEQVLVDEEDRKGGKYDGYSVSVPFDDLRSYCTFVGHGDQTARPDQD